MEGLRGWLSSGLPTGQMLEVQDKGREEFSQGCGREEIDKQTTEYVKYHKYVISQSYSIILKFYSGLRETVNKGSLHTIMVKWFSLLV